MRTLAFVVALSAAATVSAAQDPKLQSDLRVVQEMLSQGKVEDARAALEKIMAVPANANNANTYYYRGQIYKEIAMDDTAGLKPGAAADAFEAFKKALALEPKNVLMTLDQNISLFQLFDMHYNRGTKAYNAKSYDAAFNSLKQAVDVEDYIVSKGFSLPTYTPPVPDVELLNVTASAAYLAKKEGEAIPYWERLANAKVAAPEFKEIYALLAQFYLKKGDAANGDKYLNLGKQLFKDPDYWLSAELNSAGNDADARIRRYREMLQKYPGNAALTLDYAVELFNRTYVWDTKPADYASRQASLQTALDAAIAANPGEPLAYFVASQHYYSVAVDADDARREIAGSAPVAAAQRKDLIAQFDKAYDQMAEASQKAFDLFSAQPKLTPQDHINLRKVIDQLIDYYMRRKMPDKVAFYEGKKAALGK